MADNSQLRGARFSATASGSTQASATFFVSGLQGYVTDIAGSGSGGTGTWAILGGATGTTTFWQGAGAVSNDISESIKVPVGTVTFLVNGTTATFANISGYMI